MIQRAETRSIVRAARISATESPNMPTPAKAKRKHRSHATYCIHCGMKIPRHRSTSKYCSTFCGRLFRKIPIPTHENVEQASIIPQSVLNANDRAQRRHHTYAGTDRRWE